MSRTVPSIDAAPLGADDGLPTEIVMIAQTSYRGVWLQHLPRSQRKLDTVMEMIAGRIRVLENSAKEAGVLEPKARLGPMRIATPDEWIKVNSLIVFGHAEKITLK
jgi:hypothetical protein